MIDRLRELIQGRTPIVVFNEPETASHLHEPIQELKLYRTTSKGVSIGRQNLPVGSYVLLGPEKAEHFRRLGYITPESQVGTESIRAYVVSFGSNQTRSLKLTDPNIDIVVTERLTGCTFAGEMDTDQPLVAHINKLDADRLIDQERTDNIIRRLERKVGAELFTIGKPDYILPGDEPPDAYLRAFAATAMGFRVRTPGQPDRWEYFSQYCVYHQGRGCVGKRGKECRYIMRNGCLVHVITEDPMDRWSDISRAHYSSLQPSLVRQRVNTAILVTVALALAACLIHLLMDYCGLQIDTGSLRSAFRKS